MVLFEWTKISYYLEKVNYDLWKSNNYKKKIKYCNIFYKIYQLCNYDNSILFADCFMQKKIMNVFLKKNILLINVYVKSFA